MNQEKDKKVEDTTEEVDETTETNEEAEQEADLSEDQESEDQKGKDESDDDADESEDSEIDYKAELLKTQESLMKAEKKILKLKKKNEPPKEEEPEEDDDEEKDIDSLVESKVTKALLDVMEDVIDDSIADYTKNPDEIALIKHHLEHTVPPTGRTRKEIADAVENAWLIANKTKLRNLRKVSKAKVMSEKTASKPSSTGTPPKASPKITNYDRAMARRFFNGDVQKWLKFKPS